jgi:hypothetical protein
MGTGAYVNSKPTTRPSVISSKERKLRKAKREKMMKRTWRQRFRDWLMNSDYDCDKVVAADSVVESDFASDGMRLQIYRASGGFVVETRQWDRKMDRTNTAMYVITETEDLGERLGKIVMMEALKS